MLYHGNVLVEEIEKERELPLALASTAAVPLADSDDKLY